MCGFFCSNNQNLSTKLVDAALKTLINRGPNQKNIIFSDNIIFGHTRLSIRDLNKEKAKQPFIDKENKCILIYNGELWNLENLYERLGLNKNNDLTEVELIINLYKKLGTSSFKLLEGMFAFVLYDPYISAIHIVRDYFGKKPLYYHINGNIFYAASLTSTLFAMKIPKILKDNVLHDIAESRHIYGGIYKDINELKPGYFGTYSLKNNSLKLTNYFSFSNLISEDDYKKRSSSSIKVLEEEFSEILKKALNKRKCEEVKSGIILSGGIDSSLISYYTSNKQNNSFLHLNSIDNSEIKDAELIAKSLLVTLESDYIDKLRFFENLQETIKSWEYPLVHSNGVGILLLAKLAKSKNIKVLYGGEGADELFGGYHFYKSSYYLSKLPKTRKSINNFFSSLSRFYNFNVISNSNSISNNFAHRIENYENFFSIYSQFLRNEESQVQALMMSDLYDYLQPLLTRADRLMMEQGVELRMPYLDLDMVTFAINLPLKYKINLFNNKVILRKHFKKIFPIIPKKNKVGFTMDYYEEWVNCNSHEILEKVKQNFDCGHLINYYKNLKRYDIVLRIASLGYLI